MNKATVIDLFPKGMGSAVGLLEELMANPPDVMVAFIEKGDGFSVVCTDCDNLTLLLGAIRRIEHAILARSFE